MAAERDNLTISENYGRSKRATLTYTGLLAVITFTKTSAAAKIDWSGMQLSLAAAQYLAWGAAAYFLVGFCLEWRIAKLNNSHLVHQDGASNVDARLKDLDKHYGDMAKAAHSHAKAFDESLREAQSRILQIAPTSEMLGAYANASVPPVIKPDAAYSMLVSSRLSEERQRQNELLNSLENGFQGLNEKLADARSHATAGHSELFKFLTQQSEVLSSMRRDFKRLSDSFTVEQIAVFYVYDLAATLIFFVATTVFAMIGGLCAFASCAPKMIII